MRRCVAYLVSVVGAASVLAQGPNISDLSPRALIPGQTNTLRISGSRLDQADLLWWSGGDPGRQTGTQGEGQASFEINVPAATPPGIEFLQLAGPNGLSNYEFICVDPLRTEPREDGRHTITKARPLSIPCALEGVLKSEAVDYYSFTAKAGEQIPIEVVAHRLGSPMDPVVRVLEPSGRELTLGDDGSGGTRDTQLTFRCPADGTYILAVHDVGYGGGSNFDYRLRVGSPFLPGFPWRRSLASEASPPASPVSLPFDFMVNLRDAKPIRFAAAAQQKVVIRSSTRSIGSACDLILKISDAQGAMVAESDPTKPDDASIANVFKTDGEYTLTVAGLTGLEEDCRFRIAGAVFCPGFDLTTEGSSIEFAPGGTAKLKILISRFDYTGPIDLDISGLGEGISAESLEIPAGKKDFEITLKADPAWTSPAFQRVQVLGSTRDGTFTDALSIRPALRKAYPLMLYFPESLENTLSLCVTKPASP